MKYRKFGNTDFDVSVLGFGAMRLPLNNRQVDKEKAVKLIRFAIDRGINYIDTAYPYHDGASEIIVGRALENGYNEKVKIATKLPCWNVEKYYDFDLLFSEQLERLGQNKVDFYLLHSLNRATWDKMKRLGALEWFDKKITDGLIHYPGFSFHDDYATFRNIVDAYDWAICLIQHNYMNLDYQAGRKGLRYAYNKGIGIAIMEPLLGGNLVKPPASIETVWDRADVKRTPVEWALMWLWDQPEVATVLSGMSSLEQVAENIGYAEKSAPSKLTRPEQKLYEEVISRYEALSAIPCTGCNYCMPCPHHVDIPRNFVNYNDGIKYDEYNIARGKYKWWKISYDKKDLFQNDIRAAACTACGECEGKCPQNIPISRWMKVIDEVFEQNKPFVKKL